MSLDPEVTPINIGTRGSSFIDIRIPALYNIWGNKVLYQDPWNMHASVVFPNI